MRGPSLHPPPDKDHLEMTYRRTRVEVERKRRILLAVAAYAYEFEDDPIISDAEYDALSGMIDPGVSTGHPVLDKFFREEFSPDTGQWIYRHPEMMKVRGTLERCYRGVEVVVDMSPDILV